MIVDQSHLREQLSDELEKLNIPGASVALLCDGQVVLAAAGVTAINSNKLVSTDTRFQVASVTKPMTATVMMMLVEEGLVDLAAPVKHYLPDLQIGNNPILNEVTIERLFNHTSGIDGDFFDNVGFGEGCLKQVMQKLDDISMQFPPGLMRAYCNVGYAIAGRVMEVVTRQPFSRLLVERLFKPLGIEDFTFVPSDAPQFDYAKGHVRNLETGQVLVASEQRSRSGMVSAGTSFWMPPRELLKFAQLHLNNGVAPDGRRLLTKQSISLMQCPVQDTLQGTFYGKMWALTQGQEGKRLVNHYGGVCGQNSWLGLLPEAGVAIAVMSNTDIGTFQINGSLTAGLMRDTAGFEPIVPEPPAPDDTPVEISRYTGKYSRCTLDISITEHENSLRVFVEDQEEEINLGGEGSYPLVSLGEGRFLIEGQKFAPFPLELRFFFLEGEEHASHIEYFGRIQVWDGEAVS